MAKFVGMIGFSVPTDNGKGQYKPKITERKYVGNVIQNRQRLKQDPTVNQDFSLHVDISVLIDMQMQENMYNMVYVIWRGVPWSIVTIVEEYPRVNISLGDRYHGQTA